MSLCLFNFFGAGRPTRTRHRDGSGNGVSLNSSGTKQPSEVRPLHLPMERLSDAKPDASETSPCRRSGHSQSHGSIPRRGDSPGGRRPGDRDPGPPFRPAQDRIGSVRHGLARRAASVARAAPRRRLFSSGLISPSPHNRSPARGPIPALRGRAYAAARRKRSGLKSRSCSARSPMMPQFGG
jgi:hypothetical protein